MPAAGIPLGDILADSGYSYRTPGNWAALLRRAGAALIQDLHPRDCGPKGTHQGAIIANGNLYCPCTPRTCWNSGIAADRDSSVAVFALTPTSSGQMTVDPLPAYSPRPKRLSLLTT